MKKAILALLVISTVTILAHADKPAPTAKQTKIAKPVGKVPNISTRPLKPRKYPIHPSHFKTSRHHRLAPKYPIHKLTKALSNSVRKSRKFNTGPLKKQVKKVHKRKRIQKPLGQVRPPPAPRRPKQVRKVHNFARFLRAFGKQLNRPVVPVKNPRLLPKSRKDNRRKFKLPLRPHGKHHPIVFKKAEDIAGYEKFTLAEVVFPEAKSDDQVKEASDRVDTIEPIFEDEVKKVEEEENKIEDSKTTKKEEVKSDQKLDVDPRTKTPKKLDVR